jgi:hypothetical protein
MIGGFIGNPIGGLIVTADGSVVMVAAPGAYVITGQAAQLNANVTVAAGSYTISGQGIAFGEKMPAVAGAYALTGQAALLATGLPATGGAYAITGQAALFAGRMPVTAGAYTIAGQGAVFADRLVTIPGAYALTGQAALFADRMPVTSGAYTLTGQAVALTPKANAVPGSYALTGAAITFKINWVVASGSYAITGNAAPYFETIRGAGGDKKLYRGRLEIARRKIIVTDDEGRIRRVDLLRHLKPPPPFAPAPDWVLPQVPDVPPPIAEVLPISPALAAWRLPESLIALQDARDENDLVELLTNSPDPLVEDLRQVLSLLHTSGELERLSENA